MKNFKQYGLVIIAIILFGVDIFIFQVEAKVKKSELVLAMLNVGQGDSIFIESPTKTQILIDAGSKKSSLGELSKIMPLLDKSIDAIIITNPDADHIGGFLDILEFYQVGKVFEPGTFNDSNTYSDLKDLIKNKKIPVVLARKNMVLNLGGGAKLHILFPDRDVSKWNPNDGSVVAKLVYKKTSALLTGDATIRTENILIENNQNNELTSNVLKVGHHGSHTSTSKKFVEIVSPSIALISSGENNRYKHPHQDVLNILSELGIKILRTDTDGTIILKSDGKVFR